MHPAGNDQEDERLMRSLLFVPGDSEKKLEKGLSSGADVVIVDLEDSVATQNKVLARKTAADFIRSRRGETNSAIYVRINDLSTGLTDDDLASVVPSRPDGIMLPKSNSGADVQHLALKLRVHEAENGLADGGIRIIPIITETGMGVLSGASYRGASPRLAGLTWGAEDLSAAIGARATRDERGRYTDVFRYARTVTILAASAAEIAAIDTVFVNFRDTDGLRSRMPRSRARRLYREDGDPPGAGSGNQRSLHALRRSGRAREGRGRGVSPMQAIPAWSPSRDKCTTSLT